MKFSEAFLSCIAILAAGVIAATGTSPARADNTPEGENVTEARPVMARQMLRGGISFGGAELFVTAFAPGWDSIPVKADRYHSGQGPRSFEIRGAQTYFKGTSEWTRQPDGTIRGRVEMECVTPVEAQCVAVAVDIPSSPPFGLGDASAAEFDLPLADGRTVHLSFPQPVRYHSQDSRQWGGNWTVRFAGNGGHLGHSGTRSFEKGERLVWEMALAAPDGFEITDSKPLDITANDDWVRLDYRKDIVPGSALDLSGQGLQDAPAGKHGWLKAVGGHFEFENLPGVEQRFYGVNLCFTANYPDHEMADRLVDRFVRFGYNSIRVHHHDGAWAKAMSGRGRAARDIAAGEPPAPPDDIDCLDYLLAKCFERGIYVTTDLYVSRNVNWRDIGVDRDGEMNKQLFKTYVGIHDGAYSNWCHWAQAFLEHVNPYTGRAYKDEPGLPLISLINEGKLSMAWGGAGKSLDPVVRAAWQEFKAAAGGDLKARSANLSGEAALHAAEGGDTPPGPGNNAIESPHNRFDLWVNRRVWDRCSAFVRSLGCRALLTNDNNGRWHGEGEGLTPFYDYVDSHFYVDHPIFLDQQWKLPSKCGNANPIKANLPAILHRGYAKGAFKPYTITEWNFSGPGRYRGMGGILTGAMAAEQEWDGLWRFAYSHNKYNLPDGKGSPGYFDCSTDPLIAASDRASVCLYLRGDAAQIQTNAQCRMQNAECGALRLDKERGSMAIVTPHTCGGFAESCRIDAGPLSFEIVGKPFSREAALRGKAPLNAAAGGNLSDDAQSAAGTFVPTTLWASSLDGNPIAESSRILLTHLTDVQGEGARYADNDRKVIIQWGKVPLVEVGAADVELRLKPLSREAALKGEAPPNAAAGGDLSGEAALKGVDGFTVYALDTAGNRVAEVPAKLENGALRFRVSTAGPDGGRIYYEIVRTSKPRRTITVSPIFGAGLSMPDTVLAPSTALPGWTFKGSNGGLEANREYAVDATIQLGGSGVEPPSVVKLTDTWRTTITAGPDWIPLANEPWIEPGSALDFSGVVPNHAPAGKYGRAVVAGGHFEFADLPGVPQRFYGVNINGEANTPTSPEAAGRFAANLARMGYNSLRIHHHGRALLSKPGHYNEPDLCADDTMPDPEAMDRFDALVAACVRHGIYVTTDLCVSRSHYVKWRSLGIDRDGYITRIHDYKVLCSFWEPAYSNLCAWSRNFLRHVNPYTGRCLAEEPALCTLALINEGNLGNHGAGALRKLPGVKEAWEEWLASKAGDSAFEGIPATFPAEVYADGGSTPDRRHTAAFAQFLADRETRFFERFSAFVRDGLHCAAPLSNLSSWYDPVQYQLPRSRFDYVDGHFYVDHPVFLDEQWKLPSRCPNSNPLTGSSAGVPPVAFRRLMDKPFCLTEWNYSGPGRYRGVGGIATGAMGALQAWSGMWRFAWCHGLEGVESPETKRMGYFDMAGDPLSLAAERAALCLFLRGDLAPLESEAPLVLDEAALRDPATGASKIGPQERLAEAWASRVGTRLAGGAPRHLPELEPNGAESASTHRNPANRSVAIDPASGALVIDTPLTVGGFAERGAIAAGPLKFTILPLHQSVANQSATLWISSLDGAPIASSSHLLLTHLTDVQNSGIEYADPDLRVLLNWGGLPHLMRNGAAEVELALARGAGEQPPSFAVFRLSPSGRRLGEIPWSFDAASCILHFTARTDYDPVAATYLYEITRQPLE